MCIGGVAHDAYSVGSGDRQLRQTSCHGSFAVLKGIPMQLEGLEPPSSLGGRFPSMTLSSFAMVLRCCTFVVPFTSRLSDGFLHATTTPQPRT